jgi:Flp pilus assembly protein protease CpaA
MPDLPWIFLLRFVICAAVGCVAVTTDLRERKIPNWLTVPLCVAGFVFRGATEYAPGMLDALAGFGVGFGIFLTLWLLGGSAGGDVKFMAAVGTWLGPYHTFMVIVMSAFVMLLCIVVLLIARPIFTAATKPAAGEKSSLWTHTVPYALPATLAIVLRLLHMLLLGRHS